MTTKGTEMMIDYFSEADLDDLMFSDEYVQYIIKNCGDSSILEGDNLSEAMENGLLWDEFLMDLEKKLRQIDVD